MESLPSSSSSSSQVADATVSSQPRLPPELLLDIIEAVLPANPHALIPTCHISARTLLSLCRVSRATYKRASELLRQRCMYLDSSLRLADVLSCMPRIVPSLPATVSLKHITSLYLAPFGASLDDPLTAGSVRDLLCEVCETLRRLVVKMPFSSLDPLEDRLGVRRTLREGFEQLYRLEEFVCLEEYPFLSVPDAHTDIWRLWPDLKRLVLFRVPMNSHWLWWDIATLPRLEHVVLARPLCVDAVNIKDEYFHKLPRDDDRLGREIKIVLMDAAYEIQGVRTDGWGEVDAEGRMTVETYEVPLPFYGDGSEGELVTEWVKRGALDGSIWEWEGEVVS
ncbi:hypothetical protein PT974_08789 [Cladobotryum mycophilum]|uniref:F-box domain-containing protein n=1 Tax=Cladobotryum mycophilum TaxID=491253 RepID=A0ABR0SEF0_9HYPO